MFTSSCVYFFNGTKLYFPANIVHFNCVTTQKSCFVVVVVVVVLMLSAVVFCVVVVVAINVSS